MGKKSTPEIPESYKLEDLLKYNTDLNRYDAYNDFGSQTWSQDGDRWTMTQAIDPKFQGLIDKQMDFVNRGNQGLDMPGPMQDMFQSLMDKRSATSGATPGYHPDVSSYTPVPSSQPTDQVGPPPDQGQMGPPAPTDTAAASKSIDPRLVQALANSGNGMAAMGGAMRNLYDRKKGG